MRGLKIAALEDTIKFLESEDYNTGSDHGYAIRTLEDKVQKLRNIIDREINKITVRAKPLRKLWEGLEFSIDPKSVTATIGVEKDPLQNQ